MKSLKIIGLAAIAATALMAMAASSASAAKICSTSGTGTACNSGHGKVYSGTLVGKNSGNVTLAVTNAAGGVIHTVVVTTSEIGGSITNGDTGAGNLTKLTFTGASSTLCTNVTVASTASAANPWPFTVTTESGTENTNGTMTISNVTISFSCMFLGVPVTCKYSNVKVPAGIDGSDTAPKVTVSGAALELEGGNNASVCGIIADFSATYNLTTPTSLFVE